MAYLIVGYVIGYCVAFVALDIVILGLETESDVKLVGLMLISVLCVAWPVALVIVLLHKLARRIQRRAGL